MFQYLFILLFVIISGFASLAFVTREAVSAPEVAPQTAHVYDDISLSIGRIHLFVYYFVPKDKAPFDTATTTSAMQTAADKLAAFHSTIFSGLSRIEYSIYPAPVVGEHAGDWYDSTTTDRGNPHALDAISKEIETRRAGGDLASSDKSDDYTVTYIIYEGTGASGAPHWALLNRKFLTDAEYSNYSNTYFAHEFYHTLGIPDGYNLSTGTSTSYDLMGLARESELNKGYLNSQVMRRMGL